MSRISDIITKARIVLADPDKDRWSEARLLQLVDEGHKDLARFSQILKDTYAFQANVGVTDYVLPDDIWLITRATYNDCQINFRTYDDFDRQEYINLISNYSNLNYNYTYSYTNQITSTDSIDTCWEEDTGSNILTILYDRRNQNQLRVYPILNDSAITTSYTFVNGGTVVFAGDERLGVVVDITDYTFNSVFGVVVDIFDPDITDVLSSVFGVVADINEIDAIIKLWYEKDPQDITSVDDNLLTPRTYDLALQYYVIGQAFLDDLDTRYTERSNTFMLKYDRQLGLADSTSAKDGIKKAAVHTTGYRSAFE